MAFSQEQLIALETAIAKGANTVQLGGRLIKYQSLDDMLKLRDTMRAELGLNSNTNSRGRILNLVGGKGL